MMPTRKVVSVLIVCLALVSSLAIWQYNSARTQAMLASTNASSTVSVVNPRPVIATSTDWQAVLHNSGTTWDTGTASVIDASKGSTPVSDGEGTLTDQMAKDFFGQYLQLSQGGQTPTDDQATQIVQNTLSDPQFTKSTAAIYTQADLKHISSTSDYATALNYFNALKQSSIKRLIPGQTESEIVILNRAVQNNTPDDVAKIDPIIESYKGHIVDALAMVVPADAVGLHLAYINALSNTLENIEALRESFSDPVRSFASLSQYPQNILELGVALKNITLYFTSKNITVN